MLRRLYHEQPASFAFTDANQAWAEAQISKYPEGRQASAVIPLLWRAQEQEGWLTRPAIETVSKMLDMAQIRVLEVASFYFMFQMQPVGSVAHIQVCGTTSCMICGAEDLIGVCRAKIAPNPHELSADGTMSWEEVECLGACANAPMAQIGKDYYEDLTAERFGEIIAELQAGKVPLPGPQNGRYASEPLSGLTTLIDHDSGKTRYNASVQLATDIGDTVKRIDGTEVPLVAPWRDKGANHAPAEAKVKVSPPATDAAAQKAAKPPAPKAASKAKSETKPNPKTTTKSADGGAGTKPKTLSGPRANGPDDLKMIKGVGPKLEAMLHGMGIYHFDQIAKWGTQEVEWADQNLKGFKGRVSRDEWVSQSKTLASGGTTDFAKKVKKGDVY